MNEKNGTLWYDTEGNVLHAHGGHMLATPDGWYYWYGEDRREGWYVSVYRSRDLHQWEFRRHVLTIDSPTAPCRMRTDLTLFRETDQAEYEARCHTGVNPVLCRAGKYLAKINIERPKVLYCQATGKYVMWGHYENGHDYLCAACFVATCDTPDGDFVYHGSFNPYGYMSRDCTLFQDVDGRAYFLSAARDNQDMHIYRLTPDYMNVEALVCQPFQGELREAPAVFMHEGRYYMLSSYCTGWAPNQGKWSVSDRMEGPWSLLEDFGDETTFHSQPAFVLQQGGRTLYIGDRWEGNGENYFRSTYVVLPICFRDGAPTIAYTEDSAL